MCLQHWITLLDHTRRAASACAAATAPSEMGVIDPTSGTLPSTDAIEGVKSPMLLGVMAAEVDVGVGAV